VAISDVDAGLGEETTREFQLNYGENRVFWRHCDVTSKDSFASLYEDAEQHFSRAVTLLVNNAGVSSKGGWEKCMQVDIVTVHLLDDYLMHTL